MKKRILIYSLVTCLLIISSISYASSKRTAGYIERNTTTQDYAERAMREQIEVKVMDAWTDIEKTFNINIDNYFVISALDYENLNNYFEKEEASHILANIIHPIMSKVEKGSVIPAIYIRHDKKEILFCYKKLDGKNIMKRINLTKIHSSTLMEKSFSTDIQDLNSNIYKTEKKQGKPPKVIDKEKIRKEIEKRNNEKNNK